MTILSKLYQNKFFEILTTASQLQFLYTHLTRPLPGFELQQLQQPQPVAAVWLICEKVWYPIELAVSKVIMQNHVNAANGQTLYINPRVLLYNGLNQGHSLCSVGV